ncbi:hypothetical protein [Paenibacillus sp. DMB5]|uniref:hypothetical protein n=1 Tax=Paenibacillus sp. DMB5 TaxID=1780103 RepID=UPI00076DBF89|nr:hypothetical protein [Paenibacillus sp. DMB5]KUP20729.1 hypothetical protein AWJ19_26010 [Paenibacillus sp. DMB5]
MFTPHTDYDFRIYSSDRASYITFYLEQYIYERLPSMACSIEVTNNKFTGCSLNVWFELEQLQRFVHELEHFDRLEHADLSAMSPEEFTISVKRTNKKGDFMILYSLTQHQYSLGLPDITLSGGYLFDKEYHMELVENFRRLISVGRLGRDMNFNS